MNATSLIPLGVLMASLMGSWHCAAMCGGLMGALGPTPAARVSYHFGRLLGYLVLGVLAGGIGQYFFSDLMEGPLPLLATLFLGLTFLSMGIRSFRSPGSSVFPSGAAHLYSRLFQKITRVSPVFKSFFGGGLSALLPCGWLYGFVLAAVATESWLRGGLLLFFFWLGTLPALSSVSFFARKFLTPLQARLPHLPGILWMSLGFLTLGVKLLPLWVAKSQDPSSFLFCLFKHE